MLSNGCNEAKDGFGISHATANIQQQKKIKNKMRQAKKMAKATENLAAYL